MVRTPPTALALLLALALAGPCWADESDDAAREALAHAVAALRPAEPEAPAVSVPDVAPAPAPAPRPTVSESRAPSSDDDLKAGKVTTWAEICAPAPQAKPLLIVRQVVKPAAPAPPPVFAWPVKAAPQPQPVKAPAPKQAMAQPAPMPQPRPPMAMAPQVRAAPMPMRQPMAAAPRAANC